MSNAIAKVVKVFNFYDSVPYSIFVLANFDV